MCIRDRSLIVPCRGPSRSSAPRPSDRPLAHRRSSLSPPADRRPARGHPLRRQRQMCIRDSLNPVGRATGICRLSRCLISIILTSARLSLFHTVAPVSYTHLDVYKRQILFFITAVFIFGWSWGAIWPVFLIIGGIGALLSGPVSYTHLDVYKRQA